MKLKYNKDALALRDFVFEKIKDKAARRELCEMIANEYLDEKILDLAACYCDAMCEGLDRGSAAYIECFKKSFREVIEDFLQKCDEIPFIPYPGSELWNEVLTDGIAPIKDSDGKCRIWRKTVYKIVACRPHLIWNEDGKSIMEDEKILDLFSKLFGDKVTAEMFIVHDCCKETCFAEVVGVMREKLEFYKEKTAAELEKMTDEEVFKFFEQTFGEKYFRYFDLSGIEIQTKFVNKYNKFFLIFRNPEYHLFYDYDDDDEEISEECLEKLEASIEDIICSKRRKND